MAKPTVPKQSFDEFLLEAIDEALSSLGETPKIAIYFHIEQAFKIKKQEIPFRVEDFVSALESIFGLGARYLEILFIRNLHAKIKVAFEWPSSEWNMPELTFQEYAHLMKQQLENKEEMVGVNECR